MKQVYWIIRFLGFVAQFCHTRSESCTSTICEFTFVITESRSMVFKNTDSGIVYDVQLRENGSLYLVDNRFHNEIPSIEISPDMVVTADGSQARNIILVNDRFPGPTLEVVEGAEIAVKVVNLLEREGISIHWHGIHMRDNVWMDGVPYLTQCPINPRQSFTYRFIADPPGTHFYHSHHGLQRLDGLFGGIIVNRKNEGQLMPYFTAVISDWFPVPSSEIQVLNPFDITKGPATKHFNGEHLKGFSFDGAEISVVEFWSGLINGRGRKQNNAPLTVFIAERNQTHRIHIISAAAEFAYRLSIDGHTVSVIESDGHAVEPVKDIESVIVFPGERYVIKFETNQKEDRYWIRASTLRTGTSVNISDGGIWEVKAILQYGNNTNNHQDPSSKRMNCTVEKHCKVLNCPWKKYHEKFYPNVQCIDLSTLRSGNSFENSLTLDDSEELDEELFLNMGFHVGSSINRRRMIMPTAPLFQDPSTWGIKPCQDDNAMLCTHVINLPFNKTIQLVLMSNVFSGVEEGSVFGDQGRVHHPMHIHGYSFRVLKIGYPVADNATGTIIRGNEDLGCDSKSDLNCRYPYWKHGQPSHLSVDNYPEKDTVLVPAMGYTVVRFKTTNPGYWLLHCHTVLHLFEGMALIFNISRNRHPPVPQSFPTCKDFDISHDEFEKLQSRNETKREEAVKNCNSHNLKEECVSETSLLEKLSVVATSCSLISLLLHLVLVAILLKIICRPSQKIENGKKGFGPYNFNELNQNEVNL